MSGRVCCAYHLLLKSYGYKLMPKISKAIQNPGDILPYLARALLRALLIRRLEQNGQPFYKYKGTLYPIHLSNKSAAPFIFDNAVQFCQGSGIDIGGGTSPFPGADLIENEKDQNAWCLDRYDDQSLDYVFSSHCLEHLDRWQEALKLWISKIKPGGCLFLYLPHHSMALWQPQGLWVGNEHKWSPSIEILLPFLRNMGMDVLDYQSSKDAYWSFHIAARKHSKTDN